MIGKIEREVERIKSSRGWVPTEGATLENGVIRFELADLSLFPETGAKDTVLASLEELAAASRNADILKTARRAGPLFGRSAREQTYDWQSAMETANRVIKLQEHINTGKPLPREARAEKSIVKAPDGSTFATYCMSFRAGAPDGQYGMLFPERPQAHAFRDDGKTTISFMSKWVGESPAIGKDGKTVSMPTLFVDVHLFSFAGEVSRDGYAAICACFPDRGDALASMEFDTSISEEGAEVIRNQGGSADEAVCLVSSELGLGEDDIPALQRIVHSVTSLHTRNATVDLFAESEDDGYIVFPAYICFLWYCFALALGRVRMGYCMQCGNGFSLTRHRGLDRKYCSEQCKTAAKNERTRAQRNDVRDRFEKGEPIADIAKEVFPNKTRSVARSRVVDSLTKWPKAKNDPDLVRRLLKEGAIGEGDPMTRILR